MKVLMMVRANRDSEAGKMPSEELISEMGKFNEELMKAGVLRELAGLRPSSDGARVKFSGGKTVVTDGPFPETKELIAGFWIIEVKSKQEALEWARRVPPPFGKEQDGEIEVRPFFEIEDFGKSPAIESARELGHKLAEAGRIATGKDA